MFLGCRCCAEGLGKYFRVSYVEKCVFQAGMMAQNRTKKKGQVLLLDVVVVCVSEAGASRAEKAEPQQHLCSSSHCYVCVGQVPEDTYQCTGHFPSAWELPYLTTLD